jgi:hypothetical protein
MFLLHFWSNVRRQFEHMQTGIQTSRRLNSFLHEADKNFELLSNIKDQKIKNKKPVAVDVLSRPV